MTPHAAQDTSHASPALATHPLEGELVADDPALPETPDDPGPLEDGDDEGAAALADDPAAPLLSAPREDTFAALEPPAADDGGSAEPVPADVDEGPDALEPTAEDGPAALLESALLPGPIDDADDGTRALDEVDTWPPSAGLSVAVWHRPLRQVLPSAQSAGWEQRAGGRMLEHAAPLANTATSHQTRRINPLP